MRQSAIKIRNLRKIYRSDKGTPEKTALNGINLDIPRGSIFGLLGPNGAGKSTLINILAGLVRKTSGTVDIWGWDQDQNPRQSRASIGVMPQELNMDPFFTPRASLDVQAGLFGIPKSKRRTNEILKTIGLQDKADAYARTLSGGMRRRLLLGKALVHTPPILVLDEPTAGVDLELRQMLWSNIRTLNDQGMTIILTTHYLEEAQEMCDEIAIVTQGELRAQDTTENLLSQLDSKTLVISLDMIPKDLALPEGVTQTIRTDGSFAFSYNPSTLPAGAILDAIRTTGAHINDIRSEDANLEDVFLALTRSA